MKLNKPQSSTYCASVVEIDKVYPLEGRDRLQGTRIFGNQVMVSKDIKPGDLGLFFPVETALSSEFLSANNLYKDSTLNKDSKKNGYFEQNGRIRCVKFGGHVSEGIFLEIDCLMSLGVNPTDLKVGDEFDMIKDTPICTKYIPKNTKTPGQGGKGKKGNQYQKVSKLIPGQFNFHKDTAQLYKNMHELTMNSIISISDKWHGTSAISSRILTKKPLKRSERILKALGFNIVDKQYDKIFSSRSVVRNDDMNPERQPKVDMRSIADNLLRPHIEDGMTLYYELVGYEPTGKLVQKNYDYGCVAPKNPNDYKEGVNYKIYIYRITYTNASGTVFEFSALQLQQWCNIRGLRPVKELFYGKVAELAFEFPDLIMADEKEDWKPYFLQGLKNRYLEKDCTECHTKVPAEGVVLRIEGLGIKAFKLKSSRFLQKETKDLDKGIVDTETEG